jgi:hypothetical protein
MRKVIWPAAKRAKITKAHRVAHLPTITSNSVD